jgi:hypothetical protein
MFCAPGLVFWRCRGRPFPFSCFRRYRGRRVPFSCFALPESFSTVPGASGLVFLFCASGLIFDGPGCVGSRFHVLCSRTRFWWYRGRRVPFSCFCAPRLVFDGTKGVGSLFDVLRSRTRFRLYPGRRLPFSCFVRPDSFSAVLRASGSVFMFCALGLVFGGTEGVGSRFRVLRARTCFRQNRGRPIPFSCFPLPHMFCVVTRASGPFLCFVKP